jgi:phage I-like protein
MDTSVHKCAEGGTEPVRWAVTCQVDLTAEGELPDWIQLLPAGADIKALDGRKFSNAEPEAIVEAFEQDPRDLVIDWEHATEELAPRGKKAPASAWIDRMEVRNGEVWGHVKEWTPKGAESLATKEYRYFSPAFVMDRVTKVIKKITSGGLTNRPALDMPALAHDDTQTAAEWTARYVNDLPDSAFLLVEGGGQKDDEGKTTPRALRHFPYKDSDGGVDLPHLRNAIARIPQAKIAGFTSEDKRRLQAKARRLLDEQTASEDHMDKDLMGLLGLDEKATVEECKTAISTLVSKATAAEAEAKSLREAKPSLDEFVPREEFNALAVKAASTEKALRERDEAEHQREVDSVIEAASKAGKIIPAKREFYRQTCSDKDGLERFKEFIKDAPVICADSGLDDDPPTQRAKEPSTDEKRIMEQCGLTVEEFEKARAQEV